jgi:hypothetical protein
LVGKGCVGPLEKLISTTMLILVEENKIKRLKSSGSGKNPGLHFNLPVSVATDFFRKDIFSHFKIILFKNFNFLKSA